MKVPFLDIARVHTRLRAEIDRAIADVLDANAFALGRQMFDLEDAIAADTGVKHAIGVASGTDALLLAYRALGLRPGGAVITSPFTFFATTETVALAGGRPFFCDITPADYNLSADSVADFIDRECEQRENGLVHKAAGANIGIIAPVHIYGQCADMSALLRLAARHKLAVVEDTAQAQGAEAVVDGASRRACSMGDAGCLSFYPSKNLGGIGEGGMILTDRDDVAETCRMLRVHGSEQRYHHSLIGYNSRLETIQAAVLLVKLKRLAGWIEERRALADSYKKLIRDSAGGKINVVESTEITGAALPEPPYIILPAEVPGRRHTYNTFNVRVSRRDELVKHLAELGIGAMVYYPIPLHLQKAHADLGYAPGAMPVAEAVAADVLALPFFPEMTAGETAAAAEAVTEFLKTAG